MTRLLLVRHGQTPSNVLGLLDTALPGPGLTDLGIAQAQQLVRTLADERINKVACSAGRRAIATATPLAEVRGLVVSEWPELREVAAGDWEMSADPDRIEKYIRIVGGWMLGDLDVATPGPTGESGRDVLARVDAVIDGIARAGTVLVVAHGAVLRFWASYRAENVDVGFTASHPLRNTGLVVLEGQPGVGWTCESWAVSPPDGEAVTEPEPDSGPAASAIPLN